MRFEEWDRLRTMSQQKRGESVMKVHNLMHTNLSTLRLTDTLDIAEDIMRMGRIRHLPVVNAENHEDSLCCSFIMECIVF